MNKPSLIAVGAKRIGTAGWKSKHSKSIASDAAPVEYLYVPCVYTRYKGHSADTIRWVQEVPIVKKTAKQIYYTSDSWNWRKAVVSPGCINRQQFEADTRCHREERSRHGYPAGVIPIPRDRRQAGSAGRFFFASRQAAEGHLHREERRQASQAVSAGRFSFASREAAEGDLYREERRQAGQAAARKAALIKELRRAMAEAHPDHGGTTQDFIEARRHYQTALSVRTGEAS